jgi:hypothetical protein
MTIATVREMTWPTNPRQKPAKKTFDLLADGTAHKRGEKPGVPGLYDPVA